MPFGAMGGVPPCLPRPLKSEVVFGLRMVYIPVPNRWKQPKTWPQLMCCALASRNVGVFQFTNGTGFYGIMKGVVSGVVTIQKRIRTEGFRVGRD